MKYEAILFDVDGTLFDFEKAEDNALERVMGHFEIDYDKEYHLKYYKDINAKVWDEFEREQITVEKLKTERFRRFFEGLGMNIDIEEISSRYSDFLSQGAFLLEGAEELVSKLHGKYKLALVTNGLSAIQNIRLKNSPISKYFDTVVISEEVGVAKPNPEILRITFERMGHTNKLKAIIVGDSLKSDIKGGINFGIDTCWFNPRKINNESNIKPTYEINKLYELLEII